MIPPQWGWPHIFRSKGCNKGGQILTKCKTRGQHSKSKNEKLKQYNPLWINIPQIENNLHNQMTGVELLN